jgi:hypothetical protein
MKKQGRYFTVPPQRGLGKILDGKKYLILKTRHREEAHE